jgi:hypothetical protein
MRLGDNRSSLQGTVSRSRLCALGYGNHQQNNQREQADAKNVFEPSHKDKTMEPGGKVQGAR